MSRATENILLALYSAVGLIIVYLVMNAHRKVVKAIWLGFHPLISFAVIAVFVIVMLVVLKRSA